MKHFVLLKAPANRKEKYLLITANGDEFEPFKIVMRNMVRQNYRKNSIEQYSGHIARFIDYLYEAAEHIATIDSVTVEDAVHSYKNYLLHGVGADDELAVKVAQELRPTRVTSPSSLLPIGAAIDYFLTLSDLTALAEKQSTLFDNVSLQKQRKLSAYEKANLKKKSMLAGVIRGGVQLATSSGSIFGIVAKDDDAPTRVAMPYDKLGTLITKAKSHRDKTFYSLLAASGCRQHEALQVRFCDIDFEQRKVYLKNPFNRDFNGLTQREVDMLAWKGRATPKTFLIEPFKTAFFESLEQYIRQERIAHGQHDFVFQKRGGRPYFTATRQSRAEAFRKLRDRIGLSSRPDITAHSIRHSYGTYTLNYLPLPNRFGLPLSCVRVIMGHSSLDSTEVYAVQDEDVILAKIEFANQQVYGMEQSLSLNEIKLRYHQSEIDRLMEIVKLHIPAHLDQPFRF